MPAGEDATLVDERNERERRFVLVGAPRIGIDVREEIARICAPVLKGGVVHGAKSLEQGHANHAVAVNPDLPPCDDPRTGNKEIGRKVEPLPDRSRDEIVKAVKILLVERQAVLAALDKTGVVVVQTYRVVAKTLEARHEHVRLVVRQEVGGVAEVHTVKPDVFAGTSLELKMSADAAHPSVLARRRVGKAPMRKIERTPRLNVLAVVQRNPFRPARDDNRLGGLHDKRNVCRDRKLVLFRLAFLPFLLRKRS